MVAAKMHSVAHRPANDCIPTVQFNNTQNTVSKKPLTDAKQLLLDVSIIIICTAHKSNKLQSEALV